jgi:hypothetical protein
LTSFWDDRARTAELVDNFFSKSFIAPEARLEERRGYISYADRL